MKVGVVISTVNEAETIGALVKTLHEKKYWVFVVDSSTDDTWRIANDNGADVQVLPLPLGIAKHLRLGWNMALASGCDVIVQMDAGGSHDPDEIERLVRALPDEYGVVIGSRFRDGAKYIGKPHRAWMSRIAAWMCNYKTGARFTDWTSGYRAFTAKALNVLTVTGPQNAKMHGWQIEILNLAHNLDMNIVEVPITYKAGRSSFNRSVAKEAVRVWGAL